MIKKTGTLLMICCFLIAALPNAAPAAQPLFRQSLIKKNIAGLQDKLLASASDDSTPLRALTVQFLDDLNRFGFKRNNADLGLAVTQYVSDITEQATANALNTACSPALLVSITVYGTAMIQELASADAPVCMAISLSRSVASIISAKDTYDICDESSQTTPDATKIAQLKQQQKGLQIYSFTADVLSLAICTTTITYLNFETLLIEFINLFA